MWKKIREELIVKGVVTAVVFGIIFIVISSSHGLASQLTTLWIFIFILVLETIWSFMDSIMLEVRIEDLEKRIKELENK